MKQKELDKMSKNINESMEKIYQENFPEYKIPKIKLIKTLAERSSTKPFGFGTKRMEKKI